MNHADRADRAATTGRRSFLKRVTGACTAIIAVMVGLPVIRAFVSPALGSEKAENWVDLGPPGAFDIGRPVRIEIPQTKYDAWVETRVIRSLWLYTEDGESITVYNGTCTHLGCSYGFNEGEGEFRCPCHEGTFAVEDGAVTGGPPPRALDTLESRIEGGSLMVRYQDFRLGVPEKAAL